MKKIISLVILVSFGFAVFAQDIITTMAGDEIKAVVTKVGTTEVEYKKWTNRNGPLYTMDKNDIFMIKYKNGEKDIFGNNNSGKKTISKNQKISVGKTLGTTVASNNKELIKLFNAPPVNNDKKSKRSTKAKIVAAIAGITEESILANEDITVSFTSDYINIATMKGEYVYNINIENKTDRIIYIDKAMSFIVDKDNNALQFYNPNEVSNTKGKNVGGALSMGTVAQLAGIRGTVGTLLGGLSVDGGVSSYTTITEIDQQVLAIPPHSNITFVRGLKLPLFYIEPNLLKMGETLEYSYEKSPQKWSYFFTYSDEKDFSRYGTISIKAYCKYLYGFMGQPIVGGNLVMSDFITNKGQIYSAFQLSSESTKYNKWKANTVSSK